MQGTKKNGLRERTYSQDFAQPLQIHTPIAREDARRLRRRTSMDDKGSTSRQFLINVEKTKDQLLKQEDTNEDDQVTVNDKGPKVMKLGSLTSQGIKRYDVRGTYMISNLLQELALASAEGHEEIILDEERLNENPVDRLSRMIKHLYWKNLTRSIDEKGLRNITKDPKYDEDACRIYIPHDDMFALDYFIHISTISDMRLEVVKLPKHITPEYVKSINDKPGILALKLLKDGDTVHGCPFIVPGGRFNEMYGWDSYFEALGLLIDGFVDLAKSMVDNFVYEITHYGKILNANRTYYLTRSQPPFLTDMALQVYKRLPKDENSLEWLKEVMEAAISEYKNVWTCAPRYIESTGLSRYYCEGIGMVRFILKFYAAARNGKESLQLHLGRICGEARVGH
jgi:alpha,alpha-trehalase